MKNNLFYAALVFTFCFACKSKYELLGEYQLIETGNYAKVYRHQEYIRLESVNGEVRSIRNYFIASKWIKDTCYLKRKIEFPKANTWVCTNEEKFGSLRYRYTLRESNYQRLKQNLTLRIDSFYTLILSKDTSIMSVIRNDTLRNMYLKKMTKLKNISRYIYYNNTIRIAGMSTYYFNTWDTCVTISGNDIYNALKINRKYLQKVRDKNDFTASPYFKYYTPVIKNRKTADSVFKK